MPLMSRRSLLLAAVVISWFPAGSVNSQHAAGAEDAQPAKDDCSIRRQRIVSAGHSFHMFVPPILSETAGSAGIEEHTQVAQRLLPLGRGTTASLRASGAARDALARGPAAAPAAGRFPVRHAWFGAPRSR